MGGFRNCGARLIYSLVRSVRCIWTFCLIPIPILIQRPLRRRFLIRRWRLIPSHRLSCRLRLGCRHRLHRSVCLCNPRYVGSHWLS